MNFFADYQGTRQTQGIDTGVIAVPSMANRTGDLSDSLASLTGTVGGDSWAQTLSQRLGYTVTNGEPYYQAGCQSTSYDPKAKTGCVFPTGEIPQTEWSAPAKALLQYIPRPNLGTSSFSSSSYAQGVRDDKGALRLDLLSRLGQLSLYGFLDGYSLLNPYPTAQGGASVPGFNARNDGRAQLYAANLNSTFGPKMVNTSHISYMRNAALVGQPVSGQGVSLASQGFVTGAGTSGIVPQMPSIEGVENIVFNEFTMGTTVTGLFQAENIFEATDDVSRQAGSHLLSFGASFHTDQINTHPNVYDNGSFSFTGSETGSDFADFLLGVDSRYTRGDGQNFYNRNHYLGLYAQDSWRAKPSLTLNYGLRWDVLPPWYEKYNQLLTLDPNEQSVVFPNAPKGIVFSWRSRSSAHHFTDTLHKFCAEACGFVVAGRAWFWKQGNYGCPRRLWSLLQRLRRTFCRHHERESSLWVLGYHYGSYALRAAVYGGLNRAEPGTTVSFAACRFRSFGGASGCRCELVQL